MSRSERFKISHSRKVDTAERYVREAHVAGAIFHSAQSANGRYVELDGERLLNFGSCSYLALERLPQLRDVARRALDDYGTQFHFSRAYVQCPLYLELEELLERMTERSVCVAASTSLAHMAALPVLVRDSDRIVIDQFAHASLHTAVQLLPDVPLTTLRHNRIDQLDALLTRHRDDRGLIWYVADGLYSMLGDYAPFAELRQLLDKHDKLRLYIDDAHATSCLGKYGRGVALEYFGQDERVVVALSLNKAFSAAGGALALPNRELVTRIRRCGGPMLFSGPIQPPMLGAAVGSARLHLSPEFSRMQAALHVRMSTCLEACERMGLELDPVSVSPIFQAQCESPRMAFRVAELMRKRGFLCCICVFPAVPMNRPGIRFTSSLYNELTDIEPFVQALAESLQTAKQELAQSNEPALAG